MKKNLKISEIQNTLEKNKLPVPELKKSLELWLRSVQPLLSAEEFKKTEGLVEDFARPGGPGEMLHALVVKKDKNVHNIDEKYLTTPHPDGSNYPNAHWLESWWEKYAYQSDRTPLATNVNCFQSHFGFQPCSNPLLRLAWCLVGALDFRNQLLLDVLPAEYAGKNPFCSAQYFRIFSTTRIPGKEVDTLVTYDLKESDHICVNRRGNWYVIYDACKKSASDLEKLLKEIKTDGDSRVDGNGDIAAFTGCERSFWADKRVELMKVNSENKINVEILEKAIFHVILSPEKFGADKDKVMQYGCHGSGSDIWFDKAITHIMFEDGVFISNLEHSHADAVVPARCWVYMDLFCHLNSGKSGESVGFLNEEDFISTLAGVEITPCEKTENVLNLEYDVEGEKVSLKKHFSFLDKSEKISFQSLKFKLNSSLETGLEHAREEMKSLIAGHQITLFEFEDFGARGIIKKYGRRNPDFSIGPDSFMQVGLHFAYFLDSFNTYLEEQNKSISDIDVASFPIHNFLASGYETATTRSFFHGRTETIRPQSMHVINFCKLYMKFLQNKDELLMENMKSEIVAAADYHKNYLRTCMAGQGCDRILFGMRMVSIEHGLDLHKHPLFQSKAYAEKGNFTLSTSQMPFAVQDGPGFGAYNPEAYAVCYRFTHKNTIIANISSRTPQTKYDKDAYRFKRVLTQALRTLDEVLSKKNQAKL
eukprot:maker-scaffold_10-snap-gene-5.3-mRNA-1 protein AED:0.02 eAED:0.04 QI:0/0/0/1/1/1/3/0/704